MGFGRGLPWRVVKLDIRAGVGRGKFLRHGEWVRFIPAGAGNTRCRVVRQLAPTVYPRWRGEHKRLIMRSGHAAGLSPLARGTLVANEAISNQFRFIPASAGNTGNWKTKSWLSPVYPRWRGEHNTRRAVGLTTAGLSPLARGTRSRPAWDSRKERGLSPLARGTLNATARQRDGQRFIPAGAGNTRGRHLDARRTPVYPRWRGEHRVLVWPYLFKNGLSPLARGTRRRDPVVVPDARFIPAGAGNTAGLCLYNDHKPVYPRWRGEHFKRHCINRCPSGLSPLARGTLLQLDDW